MRTQNLTKPGQDPVDGDAIEITYPNGMVEKKTYCAPPAIPDDPAVQTFSPYAFLNLVGDSNMVAILAAAKTDPVVELLVKKVDRATIIDFADQQRGPLPGLQYLVSLEILSQAEFDRIVSGEFPA